MKKAGITAAISAAWMRLAISKITGRKKDIIVRGGENISSREVEDILLQHPKIHDACVVAMPDERLGERSCAYVVLKAPHHSLSLEEVVAFF